MPPGFDMLKDKVPARSIRLYDTRAGLWKDRAEGCQKSKMDRGRPHNQFQDVRNAQGAFCPPHGRPWLNCHGFKAVIASLLRPSENGGLSWCLVIHGSNSNVLTLFWQLRAILFTSLGWEYLR